VTTTAAAPSRFLELRSLAALRTFRFTTKARIEGTFSGRHRSSSRSGSGEFVDHREYSPGEDLRRLDWKIFARTGRGYIRLFQDETNLVCTLVVDASGSMRFGDRSPAHPQTKLEYAQYFATACAEIIGRQQDQIGLAVVADGIRTFVPPGATPSHVSFVQSVIEAVDTTPETKLAEGLDDLFRRLRRRGTLIVLSDFLVDDLEALFSAIRLFRHRRFEVVLLHLVHPDEERLPTGTAFRFEDLEGGGNLDCSPDEIRSEYERQFAEHLAKVRGLATASGCDYRRVSTAIPYLTTLGTFLVDRAG
jgi:uncharacterized protein (DUF58 family)